MRLKILLPVTLILTGAALFSLSKSYLNQVKPTVDLVEEKPPVMVEIFVANKTMTFKHLALRSDIKSISVLEKNAFEMGYVPVKQFEWQDGLLVKSVVAEGQFITQELFVSPGDDEYIDFIIEKGYVPYPISVSENAIVGGLIRNGTLVDIVALSSVNQNLANDDQVGTFQSVSISPVLMAVKVLKVEQEITPATKNTSERKETSLILELTRKQVAKLAIAKNIAQIEVHKSLGREQAEQLHADAGDVLPDYRAIKEYRAGKVSIR
ncbi:Flp pilus assembly protein CpaB [Vibrio tapetis subsp. quintayensis]|uniref:Flp pilus assembly protein CpaB n=1 Tax=Vibrio tapetis TaxID=52443 RepID=UPI0025B33469|nr:Flp pilus assembly protein CpaB [Vibrio tapetis]MDN3681432.1 Flp pilus assembly protein CpaB [Vibrio tapetis subsp. quintayensis]